MESKILSNKKIYHIITIIYLLFFLALIIVFLFQNKLIFSVPAGQSTYEIKDHEMSIKIRLDENNRQYAYNEDDKKHIFVTFKNYMIKNDMGKDVLLYVYEKNADVDLIMFHGKHCPKSLCFDLGCQLQGFNVIFAMIRGYEKNQFIINEKLINSDIRAISNFTIKRNNNSATKRKLIVYGNSIGSYFALRCSSYLQDKNHLILLCNPFYSLNNIIKINLYPLHLLVASDWSNSKFFEKQKKNLIVIQSETEEVLPEAERQSVNKKLKELQIKKYLLENTEHRTIEYSKQYKSFFKNEFQKIINNELDELN